MKGIFDYVKPYKWQMLFGLAIKFFGICGIICTVLLLLLNKPLSAFFKNSDAFLSMILIAPSVFFISISHKLTKSSYNNVI